MITTDLLREWSTCWDDQRIADYMAGRSGVTPRQVATDESISHNDRLWILCHALAHLDESAARGFAVESALSVVHLAGDEDDQAQYLGICNWILEIEDLPVEQRSAALDAARSAAMGAAWVAARSAAMGATRDSAYDAARSAAWVAARSAARDSAYGAAYGAAMAAALKSRIFRVLEWIGDYADGWELINEERARRGARPLVRTSATERDSALLRLRRAAVNWSSRSRMDDDGSRDGDQLVDALTDLQRAADAYTISLSDLERRRLS